MLDPPVVHDGDAIGHRHRLFLIVRDVDEGRTDVAVDLRELDLQALPQLQVERAERLVEQQNRRSLDEGPRDGDSLLLTAGQLARHPVAEVLEPDEAQGLLNPVARLIARNAIHLQPEPNVLEDVHVREQGVRLEHGVDRTLVRRQRVDAPALNPDLPLGRRDEPADQVERGRLATPGGAEQAEELAVPDLQIETAQRRLRPVPLDDRTQLDARGDGWRSMLGESRNRRHSRNVVSAAAGANVPSCGQPV